MGSDGKRDNSSSSSSSSSSLSKKDKQDKSEEKVDLKVEGSIPNKTEQEVSHPDDENKTDEEVEVKYVHKDSSSKSPKSISKVEINHVEADRITDEPKSKKKEIDMSVFDKQKVDWGIIFAVTLLLLGPFMMGEMINGLGNDAPIRAHFARQLNLADDLTRPDLITDNIWSIGFLFPFGGLFGALTAAYAIEAWGRKYTTIIFTQLMLIGNCFKIWSFFSHITLLFIGRFFVGFASASLMVTAVMWMFESLPRRIHVYYKPMIQILINFGIFFAGIFEVNAIMGTQWHQTFWAPIIFSVLMTIASFSLPESAKWIYSITGNSEKAKKALMAVRKRGYLEEEFEEMKSLTEEEKKVVKMSLKEFLKTKRFGPGIIAAVLINLAQQITGVNAIAAFAPALLRSSNVPNVDTGALIIFAIGLLGSIIFAPLVGPMPRKYMLVIGHCGMSVAFCLNLITNVWNVQPEVQILFFTFYLFIFQIGPGPLVWFISIEIFPPNSIGAAQGICTTANWIGNTFVFLLFPIVRNLIDLQALYIFIAINSLVIIYFVFFIVETLEKTPEQVLDEYKIKYKCCF